MLVIGESCLDVFSYTEAKKLAPDLPIPILEVVEELSNPGMAANVARNLEALGCDVTLATNPNWEAVTKTRFMHTTTNHAFVRVDKNDKIERIASLPDPSGFDAIVISDYNKGFLAEDDIRELTECSAPTFLDTKKMLGPYASKVMFLKLNEFEFIRNKDLISPQLLDKTVVTLGSKGALFRGELFDVDPIEVGDASGAGDAFFSVLVNSTLDGAHIREAISLANSGAREVVQHRGVTTIR